MTVSKTPKRSRPYMPTYGVPESEDGMLDWTFVLERMPGPRNYWISTVNEDGTPHAVPSWGIWYENSFYFGGGPKVRHLRNIQRDPHVVVHTESGDEVVIIEGIAVPVTDEEIIRKVDDRYETKYDMRHGPPMWRVEPKKVFAWKEFPTTPTRFTFEE